MRKVFLESVQYFNIMEIIKRKPAILNRVDLANFHAFLGHMEMLKLNYISSNNVLYASMKSFVKSLHYQAESLEGTLNINFGFENETASVNMEGDENLSADKAESLGVPRLSDLIKDAMAAVVDDDDYDDDDGDGDGDGDDGDNDVAIDDYIFNLIQLYLKEWGSFRREMLYLYDIIHTWPDKA